MPTPENLGYVARARSREWAHRMAKALYRLSLASEVSSARHGDTSASGGPTRVGGQSRTTVEEPVRGAVKARKPVRGSTGTQGPPGTRLDGTADERDRSMATYYLERWHMDPVKAQKQVVLAAEREVANREGGTKPEPPDTLSERVLATEYTGMPPGEVARALGVDVRIVLVTRYEASVTIDHGLPTASIRGLRKSHGMTQAELATRAGVSRSSIQTAERVGPSMKVRQAIASAFKVPPETLSA